MKENDRTTSGLPDLELDHESRIVRRGERFLELGGSWAQWRLLAIVQNHSGQRCPFGEVLAQWGEPVTRHSIAEARRHLDPALCFTLGVRLHYDRRYGFQLQLSAGETGGTTRKARGKRRTTTPTGPKSLDGRDVCDAVASIMCKEWSLRDRLAAAGVRLEEAVQQRHGLPRGFNKRAKNLAAEVRRLAGNVVRWKGREAVQEAEELAEHVLGFVIQLQLAISQDGKDQP